VVTFPVLAALRARFAGAHICLLTSPGPPNAPAPRELLPPGRWVDSVLDYRSPDVSSVRGLVGLLRRLRRERFDLFIELSNVLASPLTVFRDLLLARLIGCRFAVGFEPRAI